MRRQCDQQLENVHEAQEALKQAKASGDPATVQIAQKHLSIAEIAFANCVSSPHILQPIQDADVIFGAIGASLLETRSAGMPASLAAFLDDWFCGTPPRPGWPPKQNILDVLGNVAQLAATLPKESVARGRVGEVATHLTRLALIGPAEKSGRG